MSSAKKTAIFAMAIMVAVWLGAVAISAAWGQTWTNPTQDAATAPLRSDYTPIDGSDRLIDYRDITSCADNQILQQISGAWACRAAPSGGGGAATPLSDSNPIVAGTAAPGSSGSGSRGDHVHPEQYVPPPYASAPAAPGIASAGDATAWARGNHVHPRQTIPTVPDPANAAPPAIGTAAVGTSTRYARQDHRHTGRQVPSVAAGNANQCLRVNSAGNAYSWVACPSGGTATPLSDNDPLVAGSSTPGDGSQASRWNHIHPLQPVPAASSLTPRAPGTATSGSSTVWGARRPCSPDAILHTARAVQRGSSSPRDSGGGILQQRLARRPCPPQAIDPATRGRRAPGTGGHWLARHRPGLVARRPCPPDTNPFPYRPGKQLPQGQFRRYRPRIRRVFQRSRRR